MREFETTSQRRAFVFGDTSSFHLGSLTNYGNFRRLLNRRFQLEVELPFDYLFKVPKAQSTYAGFVDWLSGNGFLERLRKCDVIVTHPEGVMESWRPNGMPYAYFGKLGKELGKETWIVNFSMFDLSDYEPYMGHFDYVACRDPMTRKVLSDANIQSVLAFDCCVLSAAHVAEAPSAGTVALIRGREQRVLESYRRFYRTKQYDCAWRWQRRGIGRVVFGVLRRLGIDIPAGARRASIQEYIEDLSRNRFALTTSYHANIFCFLAGIPFVPLDMGGSRKYTATTVDLLPPKYRAVTIDELLAGAVNEEQWRKQVREHYARQFEDLRDRAERNVRAC